MVYLRPYFSGVEQGGGKWHPPFLGGPGAGLKITPPWDMHHCGWCCGEKPLELLSDESDYNYSKMPSYTARYGWTECKTQFFAEADEDGDVKRLEVWPDGVKHKSFLLNSVNDPVQEKSSKPASIDNFEIHITNTGVMKEANAIIQCEADGDLQIGDSIGFDGNGKAVYTSGHGMGKVVGTDGSGHVIVQLTSEPVQIILPKKTQGDEPIATINLNPSFEEVEEQSMAMLNNNLFGSPGIHKDFDWGEDELTVEKLLGSVPTAPAPQPPAVQPKPHIAARAKRQIHI